MAPLNLVLDAIERNLSNASHVGVALILVRQVWSFVSLELRIMVEFSKEYTDPPTDWPVLVPLHVRFNRPPRGSCPVLCTHVSFRGCSNHHATILDRTKI